VYQNCLTGMRDNKYRGRAPKSAALQQAMVAHRAGGLENVISMWVLVCYSVCSPLLQLLLSLPHEDGRVRCRYGI
jgi:hypothetical protein